MAEKEERYISISQMVAKENIETEKYRVMPRQEAIEKMAKAIKSVPKASGEAVHSTDYAKWAEAALNALLDK